MSLKKEKICQIEMYAAGIVPDGTGDSKTLTELNQTEGNLPGMEEVLEMN